MMDIQQMVNAMTPDVYERLRQAVETGKWPDGTPLSEGQRDSSMQAVMLYQATVLKSDEHMTVGADGSIVHKSKQALKQQFQPAIARFKADDL
ncbi:transcriptional regulator [Bowmanella pacifica]|uniref:Transcriptional regulator n=2 Tax=Bowmanella pacifica TaxID=502051 RepID=A0A917YY46_9ALTE|nr:transcriptional regulator [Bowmanella pacifica]